jgi:TPR repeat protein
VLRAEDGDVASAEALWRRAAAGGIALAAYNLGQLLEQREPTEAVAWYRRAVSAGGAGADEARERLAALDP